VRNHFNGAVNKDRDRLTTLRIVERHVKMIVSLTGVEFHIPRDKQPSMYPQLQLVHLQRTHHVTVTV